MGRLRSEVVPLKGRCFMLRFGLTCTLLGFGFLLGLFWGARADEGTSGAEGYVKIKLDVELRGVLSYTDKAATISISKAWGVWVLDFGEDKEMRAKAKGLNGKTVLVEGSAFLRGVNSETKRNLDPRGPGVRTDSYLDLEPKVAVKSLVVATKE
jgi:hypothetical protein